MRSKHALSTFFLIALFLIVLTGHLYFGTVQGSKDESGVIYSDATWTSENGPYTLVGPIVVNNGVTLTIEPGVTVNLNGYYILVNGTFVARGNSASKIGLNGGLISFTESSTSWNGQSGSGSIIENAVLGSTSVLILASPKLSSNFVSGGIFAVEGSPIISGNTITGKTTAKGSAIVSNNSFAGAIICGETALISYNNILNGTIVDGGTPTIAHNEIVCGSSRRAWDPDPGVAGVDVDSGAPIIEYNSIINQRVLDVRAAGVALRRGTSAYIHDNNISDLSCYWGIYGVDVGNVTIERNYIEGRPNGLGFENSSKLPEPYNAAEYALGNVIVENNTIANCTFGFQGSYAPIFIYNNFEDNLIQVKGVAVNATLNWWGTTDEQKLSQIIGPPEGSLYYPILQEPNLAATPRTDSNPIPAPTSTPASTQSSFPTQSPIETSAPQTPTLLIGGIAAAIVITGVVTLLLARRRIKMNKRTVMLIASGLIVTVVVASFVILYPDGSRTPSSPSPNPSSGENIAWKQDIEHFATDFAIGDGKVFLVDGGMVYTYNSQTGESIWNASIGGYGSHKVELYEGKVYANGGNSLVYKLDENTGSVELTFEAPSYPDLRGRAIPYFIVADGRVFTWHNGAAEYNATTGDLFWWHPSEGNSRVGNASASANKSDFVYVTYGARVNLNNGSRLWQIRGSYDEPAIVVGDRVIFRNYNNAYWGTGHNALCANASSGAVLWQFDAGDQMYQPTATDDLLLFGTQDGFFYALNLADGTLKWKTYVDLLTLTATYNQRAQIQKLQYTTESLRASPPIVDSKSQRVFWNLFVGSNNEYNKYTGTIVALDLEEGNRVWTTPVTTNLIQGYGIINAPNMALLNNELYVSGQPDLFNIDATTGLLRWNKDFDHTSLQPIEANGTIYVTADLYLIAYK